MSHVLLIPDIPGRADDAWMRSWVKKFGKGKLLEVEHFVAGDEELWGAAILHALAELPEPRHVVAEGFGATAAVQALSGPDAVPVDSLFLVCPQIAGDPGASLVTLKGLAEFPEFPVACETVFACRSDTPPEQIQRAVEWAKKWSAVFTLLKTSGDESGWPEGLRLFTYFCLRSDSCDE